LLLPSLSHICELSCLESIEDIVCRSQLREVESCLLTGKCEIYGWLGIDVYHMRQDDRDDPEVLREEDQSLSTRVELIDRLKYPTISGATEIDSDSDLVQRLRSLETSGESWILQTEESIIDTLEDAVLLSAGDTPTRCDHATLMIECDEDGISSSEILRDISREVRLSDHTLLAEIDIESFTDK
jgi:hypothetical protein